MSSFNFARKSNRPEEYFETTVCGGNLVIRGRSILSQFDRVVAFIFFSKSLTLITFVIMFIKLSGKYIYIFFLGTEKGEFSSFAGYREVNNVD